MAARIVVTCALYSNNSKYRASPQCIVNRLRKGRSDNQEKTMRNPLGNNNAIQISGRYNTKDEGGSRAFNPYSWQYPFVPDIISCSPPCKCHSKGEVEILLHRSGLLGEVVVVIIPCLEQPRCLITLFKSCLNTSSRLFRMHCSHLPNCRQTVFK
jgi:hypothetical protein